MNRFRFALLAGVPALFTALPSQAEPSAWVPRTGTDLLLLLVLGVFVLAGTALFVVLLQLAGTLRRLVTPETEPTELERVLAKQSRWQKFLGLRPPSLEAQLDLQHTYDGIRELDNPTPPWFMGLFYGTIAFGLVYLIYFHVLGDGQVMQAEYAEETAEAEIVRAAYVKQWAEKINEKTVVVLTSDEALTAGKKLYDQNCVSCHGAKGEGGVGPNLTDAYWLHGGTIRAVFRTVTEGVPEKGMIAWKKSLNPLQIQQVASYIASLQGTHPSNAKAPQGEKLEPTPAVATR
jgi:cytochrome c oxidase cbb3-type subunit 3